MQNAMIVTAPYMKGDRKIAPKAGLQLDNYEMVMKGNLNGEVVSAGKPEESYLYEVVTLPTDDEMFMPPKGTAMTPTEIDILKRWIAEGARKTASSEALAEMPKKYQMLINRLVMFITLLQFLRKLY